MKKTNNKLNTKKTTHIHSCPSMHAHTPTHTHTDMISRTICTKHNIIYLSIFFYNMKLCHSKYFTIIIYLVSKLKYSKGEN